VPKTINKNHPNSTILMPIKSPHQLNNTNNLILNKSIEDKCKPKCKVFNNLYHSSKRPILTKLPKQINKGKKPIRLIYLKPWVKMPSITLQNQPLKT